MKLLFTINLLFVFLTITQAQIFVKHDASGANNGTSWVNAFTDLQDALDSSSSNEQIWVASGTYVPNGPTPDSSNFLVMHPIQMYGGFAGTESNLSQRDWQSNLTILSGDVLQNDIKGDFFTNRTDNAHHVLIINAPDTKSVIDGLTFEGGSTRLDANNYAPTVLDIPYNRWSGGGLYLYRTGAIIRNSVFQDNDGVRGSGMYAFGDTLHTISLEFENVIFRDNDGYNGAGAFIQAFYDLRFTNIRVTGNSGFQGGGLFFSGSNATVKNSVLDSNIATYGGAIHTFHSNLFTQHPELKVLNSSFTGNVASAWGGGLFVNNTYGGFSIEVDSSSFTGNSTGTNGYGGGIEIWDQQDALPVDPLSTISITNTEFVANISGFGGGVTIETEDDSVKILIENVKFEANSGIRGGGLTMNSYAQSKVDFYMRNSEFTENVAAIGGGMSMEAINNTYLLNYLLEDNSFYNNIGEVGIGALNIQHYPGAGGVMGMIKRTTFEGNHGDGLSGAFAALNGTHAVEDSYFFANSTNATLDSSFHGGGAINVVGPTDFSMHRNIFEGNTSLTEGAAITIDSNVNISIENSLFHHQEGKSTISNGGKLKLVNNTFSDNQFGLRTLTGSETIFQNNIFNNSRDNLIFGGEPIINSLGGNISNDGTMSGALQGYNEFEDFHNIELLIGADFVPQTGSPAIDAGNPQNIKTPFDLAGNPRIAGSSIDAGSYESFTVATKDAIWNTPSFTVLPNPIVESLNFKLESEWTGEFNLLMYNYSGHQILNENLNKNSSTQTFDININALPPGEYVLIAKTGSATYASSLIVIR